MNSATKNSAKVLKSRLDIFHVNRSICIALGILILSFLPLAISVAQPSTDNHSDSKALHWRIGDEVEAKWKENDYRGKIIDIQSDRYRVFFYGLNSSEWFQVNSLKPTSDWQVGETAEFNSVGGWRKVKIIEAIKNRYKIDLSGMNSGSNEWVGAKNLRRISKKSARLKTPTK